MAAKNNIQLTLSSDEALVFFEWLSRFNEKPQQAFEDQAEQRVLWDIEAMLQKQLVEPFASDYRELLEQARARVRDVID